MMNYEEFNSDKMWAKSFSESETLLEQMADEALREHRNGKTQILDIKNYNIFCNQSNGQVPNGKEGT